MVDLIQTWRRNLKETVPGGWIEPPASFIYRYLPISNLLGSGYIQNWDYKSISKQIWWAADWETDKQEYLQRMWLQRWFYDIFTFIFYIHRLLQQLKMLFILIFNLPYTNLLNLQIFFFKDYQVGIKVSSFVITLYLY